MRKRVTWRRLASGEATPDNVPGLEVTQPIREPSFEADVLVPFAQALASGVFVGSALGIVAWLLLDVDLGRSWGVSVAISCAAAWMWRLSVVSGTLQRLESFVGVDLDGDGHKGKPSGHILAINPYQGRQEQRKDERAGQVRVFRAFVEACAVDTTGGRWESALGRDTYTAWRDLLINSGFARWRGRDRRSGWELTSDPATILQALEGADI